MSRPRYKLAVGLHYDDEQELAPFVSVRGQSELADQVVSLARRYGVPVVERPELARSLSRLELEEEIPAELFEAVAIVLAQLDKAV